MNSPLPRITVPAAVIAVIAWVLKGFAIGIAGGLDQSPLESPLFAIGLLAFLVAAASLGWGMTWERPTALRVIASFAAAVAAVLAVAVTSAAIDAMVSSTFWVWFELGLWFVSIALLVMVLKVRAANDVQQTA